MPSTAHFSMTMNMRPFMSAVVLAALVGCFVSEMPSVAADVAPAGTLVLVEKGVSRAPIIVVEDASPETVRAAEELADYIKKISGARPARCSPKYIAFECLTTAGLPLPVCRAAGYRHSIPNPTNANLNFSSNGRDSSDPECHATRQLSGNRSGSHLL